jgi:hypothetical protein
LSIIRATSAVWWHRLAEADRAMLRTVHHAAAAFVSGLPSHARTSDKLEAADLKCLDEYMDESLCTEYETLAIINEPVPPSATDPRQLNGTRLLQWLVQQAAASTNDIIGQLEAGIRSAPLTLENIHVLAPCQVSQHSQNLLRHHRVPTGDPSAWDIVRHVHFHSVNPSIDGVEARKNADGSLTDDCIRAARQRLSELRAHAASLSPARDFIEGWCDGSVVGEAEQCGGSGWCFHYHKAGEPPERLAIDQYPTSEGSASFTPEMDGLANACRHLLLTLCERPITDRPVPLLLWSDSQSSVRCVELGPFRVRHPPAQAWWQHARDLRNSRFVSELHLSFVFGHVPGFHESDCVDRLAKEAAALSRQHLDAEQHPMLQRDAVRLRMKNAPPRVPPTLSVRSVLRGALPPSDDAAFRSKPRRHQVLIQQVRSGACPDIGGCSRDEDPLDAQCPACLERGVLRREGAATTHLFVCSAPAAVAARLQRGLTGTADLFDASKDFALPLILIFTGARRALEEQRQLNRQQMLGLQQRLASIMQRFSRMERLQNEMQFTRWLGEHYRFGYVPIPSMSESTCWFISRRRLIERRDIEASSDRLWLPDELRRRVAETELRLQLFPNISSADIYEVEGVIRDAPGSTRSFTQADPLYIAMRTPRVNQMSELEQQIQTVRMIT